jgi:uncharacterized protein (TIGR02266 family)
MSRASGRPLGSLGGAPVAPLELELGYPTLNGFIADYVRTLRQGVTFVATERPLPVGTEFAFLVRLPSDAPVVRLEARVTWAASNAESPEGTGMGLEFVVDEQRAEFVAWADEVVVRELGPTHARRLLS